MISAFWPLKNHSLDNCMTVFENTNIVLTLLLTVYIDGKGSVQGDSQEVQTPPGTQGDQEMEGGPLSGWGYHRKYVNKSKS